MRAERYRHAAFHGQLLARHLAVEAHRSYAVGACDLRQHVFGAAATDDEIAAAFSAALAQIVERLEQKARAVRPGLRKIADVRFLEVSRVEAVDRQCRSAVLDRAREWLVIADPPLCVNVP